MNMEKTVSILIAAVCSILFSILLIGIGVSRYYFNELPEEDINELFWMVSNYKDDMELHECSKLLVNKNMKIMLKTEGEYKSCIDKIKRIRTERELRQIIGGE